MKRIILITSSLVLGLFGIIAYTGCIKTETATPTTSAAKPCETNNTAQVRFQNKTGTSLTYSVVWDGSVMTTISPGATSAYYTVAAGEHTLHFMIANSTNEACTESKPNLARCSTMEYWCTK